MSEVAIKEGYKETKIGWIPEEWDYKKIGNDIELLSGFAFKSSEYSDEGIRLLRCANVKRGVTDWSEGITKFWESLTPKLERYVMKEGDLVIAMDGSLVGRSFALISKNDLPCLLLQRVARIRSNKISIPFLKEWIGSNFFVKYCDSVKTVTAIPHISSGDIKKFQIPLPPLPEQKKIAQILTTWDTAIEKTEHLLQQLQLRKKGLMQQLLSGKKRLKGFKGEWEEVRLGDLGDFKNGINKSKKDFGIGNPFVNLMDIFGKPVTRMQKFGLVKVSEDEIENFNLIKGDILFVRSSVKPEGVGLTTLIEEDLPKTVYSGFIIRFREFENVLSHEFKKHCFYNPDFRKSLIIRSSVSANANINQDNLKKLKIKLPNIKEQKVLADILNQADLEIQKTKNYLTQLQEQKQGLMQQLLTGQKRVKV